MMPRCLAKNKYDHGRMVGAETLRQLGVSSQFVEGASALLGAAGSFNSLRTHKTALNKVSAVEIRYGVSLSMPWSTSSGIEFVMGCCKDGLRASSIRTYLSQIKKAHLVSGVAWNVDMYLPNQLLRGLENTADPARRRIAVTPAMLDKMFMKIYSLKKKWSLHDRRVLWLSICCLWAGSFRAAEILSVSESGFLSEETLTWSRWKEHSGLVDGRVTRWLSVLLLKPKEHRPGKSHGVKVELFQVEGVRWDPIAAWDAFKRDSKLERRSGEPVFRWSSGRCVTTKFLNGFIKEGCADMSEYPEDCYLGTHSFRAGVVSLMASMGLPRDQIMAIGRWSGDSWVRYAKEGRSFRLEDQLRIQRAAATEFRNWAPIPVLSEEEDSGIES